MKAHALLTIVASLFVTASAFAQKETAHHRAVYDAINKAEGSMQKVKASYTDTTPTKFSLTGYLQDGEVKKIVSVSSAETGAVDEYYLEGDKTTFLFSTWTKVDDAGKRGAKVEERLYFKDGEVFKWLTTEKPAPVLHSEDYQATSESAREYAAAFVEAIKEAASKSGGKAQAPGKVTEGTFTGIEQGDYFHWNMKTKSGEEVSYFIMRPDDSVEKVTENPDNYVGKKCRVTWKKSKENIPEEGGKIEIEQILSVEWLK